MAVSYAQQHKNIQGLVAHLKKALREVHEVTEGDPLYMEPSVVHTRKNLYVRLGESWYAIRVTRCVKLPKAVIAFMEKERNQDGRAT